MLLQVHSPLLHAAGNDGNIEENGIWHDKVAEVIPKHPRRNEPFRLELRSFRFDLTGATLKLTLGESASYLPMRWNRAEEGGTYDVWVVEVPGIDADAAFYHFQLFDGAAYGTFARSGYWGGNPPGGDFLLNLTALGGFELGATVDGDTTVFRVWCPDVERAQVVLDPHLPSPTYVEMSKVADHWQVRAPGVGHGRPYRFRFFRNGAWIVRNDPRAQWLERDLKYCLVQRGEFPWTDAGWTPPDLEDAIISEAHVGTFSGRGDGASGHPASYRDLVDRHVAHLLESGINVLQLMPLQEFPGELSWGYNPAFLFAPESAYGTPEDFKYLVNQCHRAGIAVWLDVVLNHFDGPNLAGNLGDFNGDEIYFYPQSSGYRDTGYGPRPDYGRVEVREMLVDSVRHFIEEYHIDGFRLDHTSLIKVNRDGWQLLKEISQMRDRVNPRVAMTVEQWPNEEATVRPIKWGGAGMDSQWSDIFHDNCREALNQVGYGDPSMQRVADALNHFGYSARQMINFIESHDEARESPQYAYEGRIVQVADQNTPHSSYGLGRGKLFWGLTMFGAAVPLTLYGQEVATEIGFGDKAANKIPWERKLQYPGYFAACRDMAWLRRTSPALRADRWQNVYHQNDGANVLAWERAHDGHYVILLANFSNTDFPSYWIGLPQGGTWHEVINTDAAKYGGTGNLVNGKNLTAFNGPSGGMPYSIMLKLPKHSMVILAKHDYQLTPRFLDADRDGMEDRWETLRNLNPNRAADAKDDPDGDGQDNLQEFLWGTDFFVAQPPRQLTLTRSPGGIDLSAVLVPHRAYRLESSEDLATWVPFDPDNPELTTKGKTDASELMASDPESGLVPRRFYRLSVRPDY
jgi:1,4-alpha-glucan branching enzyme